MTKRERMLEAVSVKDLEAKLFFKLRLEPLSSMCLISPSVLQDRVGNARTYLQKDLEFKNFHVGYVNN